MSSMNPSNHPSNQQWIYPLSIMSICGGHYDVLPRSPCNEGLPVPTSSSAGVKESLEVSSFKNYLSSRKLPHLRSCTFQRVMDMFLTILAHQGQLWRLFLLQSFLWCWSRLLLGLLCSLTSLLPNPASFNSLPQVWIPRAPLINILHTKLCLRVCFL